MLQKVPVPLPQVKSDNTSEKFLKETRQVIRSLYRAKETT